MKKLALLITTIFFLGWSVKGWTFECIGGGTFIGHDGTANIYINVHPTVRPGENMVIDLSQSIKCKNYDPSKYLDPLRIGEGSAFKGYLSSFTGHIEYYGVRYPFPLNSPTEPVNFPWGEYTGWQVKIFLTPIETSVGGIAIQAGSQIARLVLQKMSGKTITQTIIWNIYANNNVVIPVGTCDVSARDVTVNLPDYPASAAVPLSVHCGQDQQLGYYLTGITSDSANTVFSNTASVQAAQGVGIQLKRNGSAIPTFRPVMLGMVGSTPISLGLSAHYARTHGQVTAGTVQSLIGVNFVYQ